MAKMNKPTATNDVVTTLEVLQLVASAPDGYSATASREAFAIFKELEASSYVFGQIGPDTHDAPDTMVKDVRLTTNGRLLMEQKQAAQRRNEPGSTPEVPVTAAFVNYASGVLAESYTGGQIIEITCAWAIDYGVDVPFAQPPVPLGTSKRVALQKNLMAFSERDRFRVIHDMAHRPHLDLVLKIGELRSRLHQLASDTAPDSGLESVSKAVKANKTGSRQVTPKSTNPASTMDVFISHSSKDARVAETVVKLLRAALDLPPGGIRCTSVAGYKLPLGADTDEQLKREVSDSRVFVAILTPTSMKSPYVLFEMGARWGKGLFLGPLLARGATMKDTGPLSAINALHATKEPDLHQFLADVGQQLGRPANNAAAYLSELHAVIAAANDSVTE